MSQRSPDKSDDAGIRLARRALLKAGLYVPPAIVGTLLMSSEAQAQTPSCPPATCAPNTCPPSACQPQPCHPADNCGPVNCSPIECGPSECRPVGGGS